MQNTFNATDILPDDAGDAILVGRLWSAEAQGPSLVLYRNGDLYDITTLASTMSELLELENLPRVLSDNKELQVISSLSEVLKTSAQRECSGSVNCLLSPFDLQAIKACGVTFAASMLERIIEERAGGDLKRAEILRKEITAVIGDELSTIEPGSSAAVRLKELLISKGVWSQYLEVGIGPDAEIFTKCQPLSSVGWGGEVGVLRASEWNNPEPEVVLAVNAKGCIVGASLGNDVNLRDIEGRSALLLGKAKDNNASCALGPFIRLFDSHFSLKDIASADVRLRVEGKDGFVMQGLSSMNKISRSPQSLVAQTTGDFHQYPDGFALFLGTMFAPVDDRDEIGKGFSHKPGDCVKISSPKLGSLINWVNIAEEVEPWTFGLRALIKNLAVRGLS